MAFLFNFCSVNSNESRPTTNTQPLLSENENENENEIISQLNKEISSLKSKLEKITENNNNTDKSEKLLTEIRELQEENDKRKRELDEIKEENEALKDETEVLESQRNQYEIWSNQKRDKLEKLQKEYNELKETNKSEKEYNKLNTEKQSLEIKYNELQIKYEKQQENINRKNIDYEQLYKEYKELETRNEQIIKQYKRLKDDKNKLQILYENLEIEKAKLLLKNKELQNNKNMDNTDEIDDNLLIKPKQTRQHLKTVSKFKNGDIDKKEDIKKDYSDFSIQQEILKDESLRNKSLSLLKDNNAEFVKFVKKMLQSDISTDKIWQKIDTTSSGKIGTKKLPKLLSLPVIFYQATQFAKNKENKNQFKPKVDDISTQHISIWIITNYGVKTEDGSYRMSITKQDFKISLIRWLQEYIDCNGMKKK